MKIKDFYYSFSEEKYLKQNLYDYIKIKENIDCDSLFSHNEVLDQINHNYSKIKNYLNYQ
jgi:hypothetical protein